MNSNKKTARLAGLLYLLLGITGMVGIMYIPSQIIVPDDAGATANSIRTQETLYRIGIVCQLTCQTLFVFLVLTLNRLLRPVDKNYALQMVTLVVVSVPIAFVIMLNQIAALILLSDVDFLSAFDQSQLNALLMVFFKLYEHGIMIAQIFWGLWLIPFGVLVFKSGFIPRILGFFLVAGGVGYVVASLTGLLIPEYGGTVGSIVTVPSVIGEFGMIFWLLIVGVRERKKAGWF